MIEETIRSGIIEAINLHTLLADSSVKLVDATFVMPGSADNPHAAWQQKRIGNATFFDVDDIADHSTDLPHMLPSAEEFESKVSALGIGNDDFVVVYGQSGMVMGPARAWWMLRAMGHDKVCVLNGGLPAWLYDGYELNTNPPETPPPSEFKAKLRLDLVTTMKGVSNAVTAQNATIFDARPPPRFNGTAAEPREGLKSGHIPGSKNIPAGALIQMKNGKLREREDLYQFFIDSGYKPNTPAITTCGSGVTACVIALALHNQGFPASVYDGSWAEWGQELLQTEVETSK